MIVCETERLVLRWIAEDDAPFILSLVNDPDWLRYIGDRNVRSIADARHYIRTGPMDMYARLGFGLWLVTLRSTGQPIGICGLIKRDSLVHADLGFAFLPEFRGKGYAREAARASLQQAGRQPDMDRVLAITTLDNDASIRLLTALGFRLEGTTRTQAEGPELILYAIATGERACPA